MKESTPILVETFHANLDEDASAHPLLARAPVNTDLVESLFGTVDYMFSTCRGQHKQWCLWAWQ